MKKLKNLMFKTKNKILQNLGQKLEILFTRPYNFR